MVVKSKTGGGKKKSAASLYCTRNAALRKLQLRLPDFRRLCILKGIHPREPRRKPSGAHRTYYHVKDVAFLAHEPLLATLRAARSHARKVRRAKARHHAPGALRLAAAAPRFRLDGLVRERYPSFGDALRDLDDPLSLLALLAVLPAHKARGVPADRVASARRLTAEFSAYVARAGALRRAFISVKGFYFQAVVGGEPITWLVPHALAQLLPVEVDYRVMLTFAEFYEALLGFVNFKLYHSAGLAYPPAAAAAAAAAGGGDGDDGAPLRLALAPAGGAGEAAAAAAAGATGADDERPDAGPRRSLFAGCVFLLQREVPCEALALIVTSCGGTALFAPPIAAASASKAASAAAAPAQPSPAVTHIVADRPGSAPPAAGVETVQPQWVVDSLNQGARMPTAPYAPGAPPPPHLSPFADDDADGYAPAFAETAARWRGEALGGGDGDGAAAGPASGAAEAADGGGGGGGGGDAERQYAEEMAAELARAGRGGGKAAAAAAAAGGNGEGEGDGGGAPPAPPAPLAEPAGLAAEAVALGAALMTRKRKDLYKAMQIGAARKAAKAGALRAKRPAAGASG